MKQPLVSVITVTYNSAAYVRDAVESVLSQGYANIEYIIGDDCSTDNTWEIINSYQDTRIKSYKNETNIGEYVNRNKALEMTNGKYTIYIDGDDIIYPHGLSFMVTMLEAFPNSALAVVGYDNPSFIYPLEFTPQEIFRFQFFGKGFLSYSMVGNLFNTKILKECSGFPVNKRFGDYYIRLKLCLTKNCLIIGGNPVYGRPTPGQASLKTNTIEGYVENVKTNIEFLTHNNCPLTQNETKEAIQKIQHVTSKFILKEILKGRITNAIKLKKNLHYTWKNIIHALFESTDLKSAYKSEYSPVNLLKMGFHKNPFSLQYPKTQAES